VGGFCEEEIGLLLKAAAFAAQRHRAQKRKGAAQAPYFNHLIEVTDLLWRVGGVREMPTLIAALLHDTVEDTGVSPAEVEAAFGAEVCALVLEVSDDKSLPKAVRKRLQIEHAPHLSLRARLIKLADKISNLQDLIGDPPPDWSRERKAEYFDWARRVVDAGLRGVNPALEALFDAVYAEGISLLGEMRE
jgi:guanosine-3',5'-bis(diphosphate) 3'-pyrophosphohydrolase